MQNVTVPSEFLDIGMPNMPFLYAADFIEVLKKKHAANSYKEMVCMYCSSSPSLS